MSTVNAAITSFRDTYPQCDAVTALAILNDIHEEILFSIPLSKTTVLQQLTAGVAEYNLAATAIRVWACVLWTGGQSFTELAPIGTGDLNQQDPGWRRRAPGSSQQFYTDQGLTHGRIGLFPAPNRSTMTLTNATNATPIVVTTASAHGLTSGNSVRIAGVAGNLAANRDWIVTVTGGTTFSLNGSVGSGAYTGGGLLAGGNHAYAEYEITVRTVYLAGQDLPIVPMIRSLYDNGMRRLWAERRGKMDEAMLYGGRFDAILGQMSNELRGRAEGVDLNISGLKQVRWR